MTTTHARSWLVACAAALVLAGCSGSTESSEDATPQGGEAEAEDTLTTVADQSLDATVHYAGLDYYFGALTVSDLDAEASPDGTVEERQLGVELVFDVEVHNPSSDTQVPNAPIALTWNEAGTEHVALENARTDFQPTPGDASTRSEIVVALDPGQLEDYDHDSAHLVLGRGSEATAQVPLGSGTGLITRMPVAQPQLTGATLDAGPVAFTIEYAEVRWSGSMGQVNAGDALLELFFTVENGHDAQVCAPRGEGRTVSLIDGQGVGYTDLRLSERCFPGGATGEVLTGLLLDEDYAGDYTLQIDGLQALADQLSGELPVSLVAGDDAANSHGSSDPAADAATSDDD